ncbi:MAG: DNA gyrase inhibitor YacG [Pseudomonadota bacterium]
MSSPKCPICRTPTDQEWRPFCSKRCADVDLGRWMTGKYAVPAEDADESDLPSEPEAP